ncbi:maleylpyruvate isomerase family mycothiol-dependent enzyme [Mycolicibacterium grossiae]|uniref:DinB family protein n=1 Tax=Mycolicibacterium grossiae TaxID=1552759 RepID=A0A1E8Q2C7_9MYCO|nr:maleylpyruvate isomerase family mycothiol-dependent enzyme [Mycolicibacterium grossiae]OFJ52692.1 DinB family protein [Mycolicibacterium grossiae]QEM47316.1 maleylpyruvate isomerase family mycothiol-dependent enzyme [Mycolicibacterium grossiae]
MDALDLARAERLEFADLLEGLTPDQWSAPTLCEHWRVRDVVAHILSYEGLPPAALARRFAAGRLRTDRINALAVAALAGTPPDELVAMLRRHATPTGLGAGFGGRIALTDNMIHQQDVRRPLGLPRVVAADRLCVALDFARWAPLIRGAWRARGVRLVADDLDWAAGRGPEVRGSGEALLVVMAGRRDALGDLSGPGVDRLAARV